MRPARRMEQCSARLRASSAGKTRRRAAPRRRHRCTCLNLGGTRLRNLRAWLRNYETSQKRFCPRRGKPRVFKDARNAVLYESYTNRGKRGWKRTWETNCDCRDAYSVCSVASRWRNDFLEIMLTHLLRFPPLNRDVYQFLRSAKPFRTYVRATFSPLNVESRYISSYISLSAGFFLHDVYWYAAENARGKR